MSNLKAIVTNSGNAYTTHPNWKRRKNFAYKRSPETGKIYNVLEYVEINKGQFGYEIEDPDTNDLFVVGERGLKIIEMEIDQYEEWED